MVVVGYMGHRSTKDFPKRDFPFLPFLLQTHLPVQLTYVEQIGDLCLNWAGVSTSLFPRFLDACCVLPAGGLGVGGSVTTWSRDY